MHCSISFYQKYCSDVTPVIFVHEDSKRQLQSVFLLPVPHMLAGSSITILKAPNVLDPKLVGHNIATKIQPRYSLFTILILLNKLCHESTERKGCRLY